MSPISSVNNPLIKQAVLLHHKKERQQTGRVWVEGQHPVFEALHAGLTLQHLFVLPDTIMPEALPITPTVVDPHVMKKLSTTSSAVPIAAIATMPAPPFEALLKATQWAFLVLVDVQDPGNMGTLIRSACAFGLSGVLCVGMATDPYQPKVIRSSAGLVFRVPCVSFGELESVFKAFSPYPQTCFWAADAHQGIPYTQMGVSQNDVVILGGEAHGLPPDVWQKANALHIPMTTETESLNVGVAGSILMAERFQKQMIP